MNRSQQTQGFALVITLLITALVGTLVTGSLLLSMTNRRISSNDALSTQALNVAQAGSAYWKAELVNLYRFMMDNFDLYEDEAFASVNSISCNNYFAIGADLNRDGAIATGDVSPGGQLPVVDVPVGDAEGQAVTTFTVDGSAVVLRSRGSFAGARAEVVEEFNVSQIDLWNNAVFAETSAANTSISGRAEIRGSVHILGEGLTSSNVALDITGSFGLGNTYEKINPSLGVTSAVMGLTVPNPADLCATLRVKNGYVDMDGNANIGYKESENAAPFADNMRGIYIDDGDKVGGKGIVGGTEGGNVHSQNGMGAAYDAGDSFDFPELNDEIPDDENPGVTTTRWKRIFDSALVLSTADSDSNFLNQALSRDDRISLPRLDVSGNLINIPTGYVQQPGATYLSASCVTTALFGINANGTSTSSTDKNFRLEYNSTPDFYCIKYRMVDSVPNPSMDKIVTEVLWRRNATTSFATSGDTVSFSSNQLYVGGMGGAVAFWGKDLALQGGGGANARITYRGDGVLFAETNNHDNTSASTGGNIRLDMDFLPSSTYTSSTPCLAGSTQVACAYRPDYTERGRLEVEDADTPRRRNSYPATALVGLVARKTVNNDGAQLRFTAAIYAEGSVSIARQTLVAGSIVTKTFNAGSNVPTVLYVPNLAQRLSRLMPGAGGKTYAVSNVAWNRR